ncbi:hypothetical protein GGI07_004042 [Coemansia sp. Benny D115]|nr:hypothetical protein GGI07_004042 [Coemansia sp. Benny D115]
MTDLQPRLSMIALGLLAGVAGLWVYSATRQTHSQTQHGTRRRRSSRAQAVFDEASAGRTTLQRTRSIRRHRRQHSSDTIAQELQDDTRSTVGTLEPNATLANTSSAALSTARPPNLGAQLSDDSDSSDIDNDSENAAARLRLKLLDFLCTIAEDEAQRVGVIHRGTTCDGCQETPIRGTRYKCAQCADIDLCSACEAQDIHRHHIMLKIAVPLPSLMNPRIPLIRKLYPGSLVPKDLPKDLAMDLEQRTYLDRADLACLYSEFCVLATVERGRDVITRETFYKCLGQFGGPHSVLASRLFAFYDADGDGVLTFTEMAQGFSVYNKGSLEEKAPAVFRAYDVDGDGLVSRDDLRTMLEAFADTNRELTRNMVRTMEADVMEDAVKLLPGQPVSAAFTAPIPTDSMTSLDKEVSALRAEVRALRESSAARRVAMLPVRTQEPSEVDRAEQTHVGPGGHAASESGSSNGSSSAVSVAATTSATVGTVASHRLPRHMSAAALVAENTAQHQHQQPSTQQEQQQQQQQPNGVANGAALDVQAADRHVQALALAPTFWHDHSEEDDWSVMEALSQDAIRMMVDEIFTEAATSDPAHMTFREFLRYLRRNSNLAVYLEVLGTIF